MERFVFFLFFIGFCYFMMKLTPGRGGRLRTRFDYDLRPMAFYRKPTVIVAVLFWLFLLIVGIFVSDPVTTAGVLTVVAVIYAVCVAFRLRSMHKMNQFKKHSIQLPGRIVGLKRVRRYGNNGFSTTLHLIVEYEDPHTNEKRDFVTKSVNANPFYCLKSLDVTVYYQTPEQIWVEGFQRSRDGTDNIASQVTGDAYGKDPGVLRYE